MSFLKFQNWAKLKSAKLYTRMIRKDLASMGKNTLLYPPFHSNNLSQLHIGDNCQVHAGSWIDCVRAHGGVKHDALIEIGDNCYFGRSTQIVACGHLKIGREVVFADNVFVSDHIQYPNSHFLCFLR